MLHLRLPSICLSAAAFAALGAQASHDFTDLDASTYKAVTSSGEVSYIAFSAPGCTDCDVVHELLKEVIPEDSNLTIGTIDCTKEPKICDDAKVLDVPTLLLSTGNGDMVKYKDGWELKALRQYIQRQSGPAVSKLSLSTYQEFAEVNTISIVAFLPSDDDLAYEAFARVAEKWHRHYSFGIVNDSSGSSDSKQPSISITRPLFDKPAVLNGPFSAEDIETFMLPAVVPLLQDFDSRVYDEKIELGKPLAFLISDSQEERKQLSHQLAPLARALQPKMEFVVVNSRSYPTLAKDTNLPPDTNSGFAIEDVLTTRKYPMLSGKLNVKTITKFTKAFLEGTHKPLIKSEAIPISSPDSLVTLVGHNFESFAFDAARDVLVEFSVPWCEYCDKLHDQLRRLGSLYKDHQLANKIAIAKIDVSANDVPVRIEQYPTLKLFRAESNDIVTFNGTYHKMLTVHELADFVQAHATHGADVRHYVAEESEEDVGGIVDTNAEHSEL